MILRSILAVRHWQEQNRQKNLDEWYRRNPSTKHANSEAAQWRRQRAIDEQRRIEKENEEWYRNQESRMNYCESCVVVGFSMGNLCDGSCAGNEDRM